MGISIGLVGLGEFGAAFAKLFKSHPLVDRIALCDFEHHRMKKFSDDPFFQDKLNSRDMYTSLDDMCKSDIDALVIITQPWLHAPQCIQAMESGKHVYSAVPLTCVPDADEVLDWCDKIVETTQRTGRHYMLGETTYYHPEVMFMRRQAALGMFGRFVSAEAEYSHDYSGAWGCSLREVFAYRTDSKQGRKWPKILKESYLNKGIFDGPMHYPTHSVSGPVSIMNAHALKVSAIGTKPTGYDEYFDITGQIFSNETGFFHMSNGSVVTIREHREITAHGYDMNIYGTCATWRGDQWYETKRQSNTSIDSTPKTIESTPAIDEMRDVLPLEVQKCFLEAQNDSLGDEDIPNIEFTPTGHKGSHPYLVHEFCDAVAKNRMPAINAWEAARYMAMGATAHKSALKDGEILNVPDWGDAPT
ncbi:MAG: Gfo/Idh/MocA family oxidoreductase [Phycisphaeraceae bacterium]|nr:Gfo/Idh/MocA family oxidoreductase [Phycisphaeraceae bacterium]